MTKLRLVGIAVVLAAVFGGAGVLTAIVSNRDRADESATATGQLCAFVDNEHNKDRAEIVKAEREIYHPPPTTPDSFKQFIAPFIDTADERAELHRKNKQAYNDIRKTRPDYCADVRKNPVKPYPSLEELR